MARFRLGAVILNYRTPELVADCLASLEPELDPARDAVVVVDNASGDDSAERIERALRALDLRHARLVQAESNAGFAAGNNRGIEALDAEVYLLLNSDTLVRPGAVERLLAVLAEDPGVGIASPRLEWRDGRPQNSCFRFHTPWSELIEASGSGPVARLLRDHVVAIPWSDEPLEPDWTSFAAVAIRREALERAGPLDEGFFMYFEDVDFCRRVREAGFRVRHEPRARVVHLRGGTSPVKALTAARKRRPAYYYASRRRYFERAGGRANLLAANLLWTLGRAVSWLRETFGRKAPHTVERQLLDVWRG